MTGAGFPQERDGLVGRRTGGLNLNRTMMKKILFFACAGVALLAAGCGMTVKYSLSGASIPPDAKTFSVAYFPNNATMVAPILSSTLTEALQDKFTRQTRLTQVEEGGDFAFEGETTGHTATAAADRRRRGAYPADRG